MDFNHSQHIRGPHGEHFDLISPSGATFLYFVSKQTQLNVFIQGQYVTQAKLFHRGLTMHFDIFAHGPHFIDHLNAKLQPLGGSAWPSPTEGKAGIMLSLCEGHVFTISQRVEYTPHGRAYLLNIKVNVPGCHDQFDGVLGQLFRCERDAPNAPKLEWTDEMARRYRLASLDKHAATYDSQSECHELSVFGTQPMSSTSSHKTKQKSIATHM